MNDEEPTWHVVVVMTQTFHLAVQAPDGIEAQAVASQKMEGRVPERVTMSFEVERGVA